MAIGFIPTRVAAATLGLMALSSLLPAPPSAQASVYRCRDGQGVPLFSQYPCAPPDAVETMVITSISVIPAPKLTRSEQATLERINRQFLRNQAQAAKDQRRARRRTGQQRAERALLCARSRDALERLRERRRGGYSLATSRTLDAEEARLKAEITSSC